jgi:sugar lactone lactonase YvrE
MLRAVTFFGAASLAACLTACGGGGGASALPSAGHASVSIAPQATTISLFIPKAANASASSTTRKPAYIPDSVGSFVVTQTENAGSAYAGSPVIVPVGGASCTPSGSGQTCTVNTTASDGVASWTILTYTANNGTGSVLSSGIATATIAPGVNVIPTTLNPVPATLAFIPTTAACSYGVACTVPVALTIKDATGAIIVGPGTFATTADAANPVTLVSSSPHVSLQTSTATAATLSISLPASNNLAQAAYSGVNSGECVINRTITASATGVTSAVFVMALGGVGTVSTFTGKGTAGFANGAPTVATFSGPAGIAFDSSGNLYVADTFNDAIRKIDTSGNVSTYAGTGAAGNVNGPAASAKFNGPIALAFDTSGNLFVADQNNNEIREISGGVVSTLGATFPSPVGVAVDGSGNVYASVSNSKIVEFSGGTLTTFAGTAIPGYANGAAATAQFNAPRGLAYYAGTLYVADSSNNVVRAITAGTVTDFAGNQASNGYLDGPAASALFHNPQAVAVDASGNVYVADEGNYRLRKISSGTVSTVAGNGIAGLVNGPTTCAEFWNPTGIALDASGNVYASELANEDIRKVLP